MENIQDSLMPPPGWNPYSRAAWTELQLQFRPPRDGPSVGTRLRHYATAEEIDVALAALQQSAEGSASLRIVLARRLRSASHFLMSAGGIPTQRYCARLAAGPDSHVA